MPTFYPSCAAHLWITIDLRDVDTKNLQREVALNDGTPRPYNSKQNSLFVPAYNDPNNLVRTFELILNGVVSAEVERNSVRSADNATLKFDYKNVPIDPRVVRACIVAVHYGTVKPSDFARGNSPFNTTGDSIVSTASRKTMKFFGYVDYWTAIHAEDGAVVTLKARDMTQLLIDTEVSSAELKKIKLGRPLDEVVKDVISLRNMTRGFKVLPVAGGFVESKTSDALIGSLPDVAKLESLPRTSKGADGKTPEHPQAIANIKMWDFISDICGSVAYVPYVDLDTIVLRPPHTLFTETAEATTLTIGKQVKSMELERKLGAITTNGVEYRAYVPGTKQTISGRWPKDPQGTKIGEAGKLAVDEYKVFYVDNINDPAQLQQRAREAYEEMGRQEFQGNMATDDPSSTGDNNNPDMMDLAPGDPILINYENKSDVQAARIVSMLGELNEKSSAEIAADLVKIGYPEIAASMIGSALKKQQALNPYFYVKGNRLNFSAAEGFTTTVDFVNYMTTRNVVKT